jgi:hypothetical protein
MHILAFVVEAFSKEVMCLIFVGLAKFRKTPEKKDAGDTDKMIADWKAKGVDFGVGVNGNSRCYSQRRNSKTLVKRVALFHFSFFWKSNPGITRKPENDKRATTAKSVKSKKTVWNKNCRTGV